MLKTFSNSSFKLFFISYETEILLKNEWEKSKNNIETWMYGISGKEGKACQKSENKVKNQFSSHLFFNFFYFLFFVLLISTQFDLINLTLFSCFCVRCFCGLILVPQFTFNLYSEKVSMLDYDYFRISLDFVSWWRFLEPRRSKTNI